MGGDVGQDPDVDDVKQEYAELQPQCSLGVACPWHRLERDCADGLKDDGAANHVNRRDGRAGERHVVGVDAHHRGGEEDAHQNQRNAAQNTVENYSEYRLKQIYTNTGGDGLERKVSVDELKAIAVYRG